MNLSDSDDNRAGKSYKYAKIRKASELAGWTP
jgi:hypothetical protein